MPRWGIRVGNWSLWYRTPELYKLGLNSLIYILFPVQRASLKHAVLHSVPYQKLIHRQSPIFLIHILKRVHIIYALLLVCYFRTKRGVGV